ARVNAVSRRHGEESRRIWAPLWPDREAARVPITDITNGVHVATWMANRVVALLESHLGADWWQHVDDPAVWARMLKLDDFALWAVHNELKSHLMRSIREQARRRWADQWKEALHLVGAGTLLDHHALTIGFGRRFATYKRADLIFRDPHRLQRLLVNPWRPVQIVFAGKAHPGDEPGKQVLQRVYAHTREARDVPLGWMEKMKHALCVAGQRFSARRMLRQYVTEHYVPAIRGQLPGDDPPTA